MIIVTSVPGSGTHFARDELLKDVQDVIYTSHTYPASMGELSRRLTRGDPCVVPIRSPIEVARSWKRRGKDPRDAIPFWERLITVIDQYPVFYLPMDREDRDEWLQSINDHLEFDHDLDLVLKTDWPMVGQVGYDIHGPPTPLERDEVIATVDLLFKFPEFFERFDYLF